MGISTITFNLKFFKEFPQEHSRFSLKSQERFSQQMWKRRKEILMIWKLEEKTTYWQITARRFCFHRWQISSGRASLHNCQGRQIVILCEFGCSGAFDHSPGFKTRCWKDSRNNHFIIIFCRYLYYARKIIHSTRDFLNAYLPIRKVRMNVRRFWI